MIELYCKLNHCTNGKKLCSNCAQLKFYAMNRLELCPFDDEKPACNACKVHCYRAAEKEQIREIMRFSGPKMLFHHPYLAIMHILDNRSKVANELSKKNKR